MRRKTTRPTAKENRAAAVPSPPHDAPAENIATPDNADAATRIAASKAGPGGAGVRIEAEDHNPTAGDAPVDFQDNACTETNPSHYEVVHAAVGGHYKGERIKSGTFSEEQTWRLLEAGAIIPMESRSEPWH